ncbi:MAG: hypothetical protein ACK5P6_07495 [Pseudobdellovibrionaceae bacterium]
MRATCLITLRVVDQLEIKNGILDQKSLEDLKKLADYEKLRPAMAEQQKKMCSSSVNLES